MDMGPKTISPYIYTFTWKPIKLGGGRVKLDEDFEGFPDFNDANILLRDFL